MADVVSISSNNQEFVDFFWIKWLRGKKQQSRYEDKTNIMHTYWIWYCIKKQKSIVAVQDFRDWLKEYADPRSRQEFVDNLTPNQFIALVFSLWRKDKVLKPMLTTLGVTERFIQNTRKYGLKANWPPS